MEEDRKKIILFISIIAAIILIIVAAGFLFFYLNRRNQPVEPSPINQNQTPTTTAGLPQTLPTSQSINNQNIQERLAKEKYFISAFYQPVEIKTSAKIPATELPIQDLKEKITNFRDFSRKINIDSRLDKLSANSFSVIENPFAKNTADWQSAYAAINEKNVPILITSDAALGLYQDTLQIVYKEIELEKFYPSLWQVLKDLFNQAKNRYDVRRQKFGIESDLITEANRLELAYLSVALKLLKPDQSQIKESLTSQQQFFSPFESELYAFAIPGYLINEVEAEIKLIDAKVKQARSPILLYQNNYAVYNIPAQYQISEKLKNYYLAITWLNQILFPLNFKNDACPDCLLDEADQTLNFLTAIYLSNDLSQNQNLKNQWANIYKTIAFFKGLETDLTYLDYEAALKAEFGDNFNLDEIFPEDLKQIKEKLNSIKSRLLAVKFPIALKSSGQPKDLGLRLLRNYHLMENKIFNELSGEGVGPYLGNLSEKNKPATACQAINKFSRCFASVLDLFNALNNQTAAEILAQTKNSAYQNYPAILTKVRSEINEFDENTWHDNSYLSLLAATKDLKSINLSGYPAFFQTPIWQKKSLEVALSAWTTTHREIKYEKTAPQSFVGLPAYFGYGYIEPQFNFYADLLANARMIKNGFKTLQIINSGDRAYERLNNLENILNQILQISKKELENQELSAEDYDFINNFAKQINFVTGDVKKENLQNIFSLTVNFPNQKSVSETINGFKYLIVVYPDQTGRLFLAIGPILNYSEKTSLGQTITNWQNQY